MCNTRKVNKVKLFILIVLITSYYFFNMGGISVNAQSTKEEIYSDVKINDNFDDSCVFVIIKPTYSKYNVISDSIAEKIQNIENVLSIENCLVLPKTIINDDGTLNKSSKSEIVNHLSKIDYKQVLKVLLKEKGKERVVEFIQKVELYDEVLLAEPNYYFSPLSVPNDTSISEQWNLIGENGIDMPQVWDFSVGSNEIRVGVIDTGVANHNDLSNNLTVGYDFYKDDEDEVTTDDFYNHGTQVAGIIGAIGNNEQGGSGINHKVTIVPMQVYDYVNGELIGDIDSIENAIEYAIELWDRETRIAILNYSISGFGKSVSLLSTIELFPGLFVWSAGNDGENVDNFTNISLFNSENIISVGAHDKENKRSVWNSVESSNYGEGVDIYAPGGKEMGQNNENCYTTSSQGVNSYRYFNGTSCAAPHVSGVAALILSINPNLTASDLKNIILNSAENINMDMPNDTTQNVRKLNAFNAVKYVLDYYAQNSYSLTDDGLSIEKTIQPSNSYFYNKNMFIKLNVTNSCDYEFVAFANNYSIDIKLYDSNLNEVSISKTYMESNRRITFIKNLSIGEYYVRVYSSYSESQIVDLDIQTNHTHSYTLYKSYSSTQHKAICSCGEFKLQFHIVGNDGLCVLCRAIVSPGIHPLNLNNVTYITENGSYILPNGVIIIVEADMDCFIKNKTDIYSLL